MTALAQDRHTARYGTPDIAGVAGVPLLAFPVAAATKIYAGAMVATDASGNAVTASAVASRILWGRCEKVADNSSGAAADIYVNVSPGLFEYNNSTGVDLITKASVGQYCYAVDDNTVALTDRGGTLPLAGTIFPFDPANPTQVIVGVGTGASPYATNPELVTSGGSFRARTVVTANVASLAAYTVASNGDGVTPVAGDTVLLVAQTTAAQNGPYVVGTVATGVAPLVRPDWFAAASTQKSGAVIIVGGEGTVFKNTSWRAMVAADTFVVDTTDGKFYPTRVSGSTALVAGTFTISTVPVFSTKSVVTLTRAVANTSTSTTGGYAPTVAGATGVTTGVIGTAAVVVQACVAAGTINNADISTLNWTIDNQA